MKYDSSVCPGVKGMEGFVQFPFSLFHWRLKFYFQWPKLLCLEHWQQPMFGGRFVNSKMMQSWGKWLPPHPIPPPPKKKIGFVYFLQCIKYNFMPQYDFIHCLQLRNAHTGSFYRVKLLVVLLAIVDFMAFARFPINEGN